MASIDRTAYPRFGRAPTRRDLDALYTPTPADVTFVTGAARSANHRLTLMVVLKCFQRLGYVPRLADVPVVIAAHLRAHLRLPADTPLGYDSPRTMYRHHQAVRAYLGVAAYGSEARHVAVVAVHGAAQTMDNPADLINVAIEELIRRRYELPAFSTLDRLARRVRTLVNRGVFAQVQARLDDDQQSRLEHLLDPDSDPERRYSAFNRLKEPPRSVTLTHMREWQAHLAWLLALGETARPLAGIPPTKVRHFAAEARALNADGLRDMASPKRHALLLCLLHRAQVTARDALVEMLVRRLARLHTQGKEALVALRERQRAMTERLVAAFAEVLEQADIRAGTDATDADDAALGRRVRQVLDARGGPEALHDDCAAVAACSGNNYLPLLWPFYRAHRAALFRLVRLLDLRPTTRDTALIEALGVLLANEHRRGDHLPEVTSLDFATEQWRRAVLVVRNGTVVMDRRLFELCAFTSLAAELRTGDLYVEGSEDYADYRAQLLPWEECVARLDDYCQALGFVPTAAGFVADLKMWLATTAERVDQGYPDNGHLTIGPDGVPVLKRLVRREPPEGADAVAEALREELPERTLLDVLCNAEHWTHWTRHFGPPSGADPKLERAAERYILTTFGYGCGLGPTQLARHTRGLVTPHMVSSVNRQHVTIGKLEAGTRDLITAYHRCDLTGAWGTGKVAAADGTKVDLAEDSLLSEYSIRYGEYGGIAYHYVADTYVATFSRFISCGTWEAIYILDVLFTHLAEEPPDELHADTQGQSAPVFGLAYLLGVRLLPRIRNWGDLTFHRPEPEARYRHIDPLFGEAIDWDLLETHWPDLLQVTLSIQAGRMLPSTLLRKLGTHSRKSRLYQAFRELGRVVRTVFLLEYISSLELREQIQGATNKVEAYHGFTKWLSFGGEAIAAQDPEEQEKRLKYLDLVAHAVLLQNVADMTEALPRLARAGHRVTREVVATLSPYQTRHLKRFGDYVIDLDTVPQPLDGAVGDWLQ